ncbi:MAG TPA: pitrilysin family protein [Sphingomicrobium sp.]|nr:pitrilysin family protein [Sphingomicrobium sp.]
MMRLTTLPNGLRVASRGMKSVETVAVGLYADTGSRYEPARLNGVAHLFEHMVFKGAGGRSAREISEVIEDVGGDLNASTDKEGTAFYASLLAPDLPLGVALIADLIRRPHFEERHLATEKKVVRQELVEACETACDIVFEHLHAAAFPEQALGRSVLGSDRTLDQITADDLREWLATHYAPNRLILVAAGKLDHDQLVDLAEGQFGDMAPVTKVEPEPGQFVGGWRYERRRSRQAHVAIGMRAPAWNDPGNFAAQLFADIAGTGTSSRLFQELREQQGLAYSVSAAAQPFSDCGLFSIYLATDRGDAKWAQEEVERVLAEAVATITGAELSRARALAKAGMMMSLESCWGQASYVASRLQREGRLVEPGEIVERLDKVTLEEVRAAGERMLSGPRALASVGGKLARAA